MSRNLPENPNLEHLRKQAKELLPELQRHSPGSKLADAQHAIAREYGFVTWAALKAHVLSIPRHVDVAGAAAAASPFAGRWFANLSKSRRHPLNEFQRATLEFEMAGDTVRITDVVVGASGQEQRGTNTIQVDGREHASAHGYVLIATWRGSHTLETVAKQHGEVVGRGKYEVSADGATLTVSTQDASANANGWQSDVEHLIVLERTLEA